MMSPIQTVVAKGSLAILFLSSSAHAFVPPTPMTHHLHQPQSTSLSVLPDLPIHFDSSNPPMSSLSSLLLSDGVSAATYANNEITGPLSALRTFFIVAIASIFGITALAYLTAAFLVPRAAEQLERDTKRLRPGLWEEYQAKLGEGETMVNRPDLLQELGNIMQPIIVQDYEREAALKFGEKGGNSVNGGVNGSSSPVERGDKQNAVDVTVQKSNPSDQWKD